MRTRFTLLTGMAMLAAMFAAHADTRGVWLRESPFDSSVRSPACDGSCVTVLRFNGQAYLGVRDPATGKQFKVVPLGLSADAVLGDPVRVEVDGVDAASAPVAR